MLYKVEMEVSVPHDVDMEKFEKLKAMEKDFARKLQEQGKWRHLWRVSGSYKNVSIFDVADNDELHEILSSLPLSPYINLTVTPLCRHPSSIHDDDR